MEQATALQNENGANQEQGTPRTFSVKVGIDANGNDIIQDVDENELVNGYLRQSDYTRKTQEIAEEKRLLEQKAGQAQNAGYTGDMWDDAAVEAYLQSKGYAKQDTVEKLVEEKMKWMTKKQQDEQTIQSLLASNPNLKQFEGAIRKIAASENDAIEDIVVKYGFSTPNELSKAKQRGLVWGWTKLWDDKAKPVSERTKEDWAKFEAQNSNKQFR